MQRTRSEKLRFDKYGHYRRYLEGLGEDNAEQHYQLLQNLIHAMETELTNRQQQYVRLYYGHSMTMPEIARSQQVSVSTVSRTLSRARTRLSRCLRFGAKELLDSIRL